MRALQNITDSVPNATSNGRLNSSMISLKNKYALFFSSGKSADLITDALEFMYTHWPDNSNKYALKSQLVDLLGDNLYFAPDRKTLPFLYSVSLPIPMFWMAVTGNKVQRITLISTGN